MRVGADIESICRKCGDVWHVVVALDASRVAKVECKQCGAQHRYRPPEGAEAAEPAADAPKAKAKAKPKARTSRSRAKAAPPVEGPRVKPDLARPVRPYGLGTRFEVGDRIQHRTFGVGTVEAHTGPCRLEAWFDDGRRVLAHDRKEDAVS